MQISIRFRPADGRLHRVTGRRVTERRDAEAIFSPAAEVRGWDSRVFALPSLLCHQIAIGLAMAIVE